MAWRRHKGNGLVMAPAARARQGTLLPKLSILCGRAHPESERATNALGSRIYYAMFYDLQYLQFNRFIQRDLKFTR